LSSFSVREFRDRQLGELSAGCQLCYGFVEEHVMFSAASMWTNRRQVWSVEHNAQEGIEHLKCAGELPAGFYEIRDRLLARQRRDAKYSVDYIFAIPVEVTERYWGFSYDRGVEGSEKHPFAALRELKRKGFLSFLSR
jgi:hypothetical protein